MSGSDADAEPVVDEPETGWPNEPDEFNPEDLGPDIPSPKPASEADNPEAVKLFGKLVVVFNAAILALAVGPMFIVFQGRLELGLQIFFVGVLLFAYGTFRYYQFRENKDDGGGDGSHDADT